MNMKTNNFSANYLEEMSSFHNYLLACLFFIGVVVFWMLHKMSRFHENKNQKVGKFTHASTLEIGWTVIPAIILVLLSTFYFGFFCSFDTFDTIEDVLLTVKIFGNQWFWGYEYELLSNIRFDSYMIVAQDLPVRELRLLEVDNKMILPIDSVIRILITGCDVIHNWSSSFGLKIDATSDRLSQSFLYLKKGGTYYGQCSEICGINQGFMPIMANVVSLPEFHLFVEQQLSKADVLTDLLASSSSTKEIDEVENLLIETQAFINQILGDPAVWLFLVSIKVGLKQLPLMALITALVGSGISLKPNPNLSDYVFIYREGTDSLGIDFPDKILCIVYRLDGEVQLSSRYITFLGYQIVFSLKGSSILASIGPVHLTYMDDRLMCKIDGLCGWVPVF